VAYFIVVQIAESVESLPHYKRCLGLSEMFALGNEKEKLASFAKSAASLSLK
jgi:hypothetical protein